MQIPIEIIVVVLTVFFGAIGTLIGVVIDAFRKNTEAFKNIGDSINEIRIWITKKDTAEEYEEKECVTIHKGIAEKFTEQRKRLDNHEHRISKLEK